MNEPVTTKYLLALAALLITGAACDGFLCNTIANLPNGTYCTDGHHTYQVSEDYNCGGLMKMTVKNAKN